jgi:hypothetical protein
LHRTASGKKERKNHRAFRTCPEPAPSVSSAEYGEENYRMGLVTCTRCGKEWDSIYVEHELSESERMDFHKGMGCPECRNAEPPPGWERRLARRSIAENLEEISDSFVTLTLKCTKGVGKKEDLAPGTELYELLEEFFMACQRAEEHIKFSAQKDFIDHEEVEWINEVIRADVTQVLQMAQHTSLVNNLIIELAETKPVIMEILRSFTSPSIYRDFQWYTRSQEPLDPAPL